jgi:Cu(I)/Ag(I) efflux system protein CusF
MKLPALVVLLALTTPALPGGAASGAPQPASPAAASQAPLARGEVLEVDRKEQRVLMKHGPIRSLGMDAMTMEFLVPDRKLLAALRPGDQVRFAAVFKNDDYVLTRVEVLKRRGKAR